MMRLEDVFGIDIPDEDADTCRTVGDLINYCARREAEKD